MKPALLSLLIIAGGLCGLYADVPFQALEPTMANQQLALLNRLVAVKNQPDPKNQLQTISVSEILSAINNGYSGKEIYEMASATNDPRLPQWKQLGGYHLHPNVQAYLSPMSSSNIALQVSPTPEPAEDAKLRMQNLERMKAYATPTPKIDESQEMLRIYRETELMQMKVREKILNQPH
jgi:hypothetical protein